MITTKRAALGAAGVCLILLAGCGKETMTSYEAEKSRIRDALPKTVICSETSHGVGMALSCKANAFNAVLFSQKGMNGQEILGIEITYNQLYSSQPVPFEVMVKLLSAYDFTASDLEICGNELRHSKQAKTYVISCRRFPQKSLDYTVSINAQTAI